jgi:hypothetical protein
MGRLYELMVNGVIEKLQEFGPVTGNVEDAVRLRVTAELRPCKDLEEYRRSGFFLTDNG